MLAQLPVLGSTVTLQKAVAEDVLALVQLLAAAQLGSIRDGVSTAADLRPTCAPSTPSTPTRRTSSWWPPRHSDPGHHALSFFPGLARRGALRAQIEGVGSGRTTAAAGWGCAVRMGDSGGAPARLRLVQLTTDKSRADAHRFYGRLGFVASHEGLKLTLHP